SIDSQLVCRAIESTNKLGVIEMRQALRESVRLGALGIDAVRELLVISSYLSKRGIKGKVHEEIVKIMSAWFERLSKMGCMPIGSISHLPLSVIQLTNQDSQVLNKALLQLEEVLLKTNEEDRMLMGASLLRMNVLNYLNTLRAFEKCISYRRKNEKERFIFEIARQVLELTNYGEHAILILERIFEAKTISSNLLAVSLIPRYASYHQKLDSFSTYLHMINNLSDMILQKGMNECDIISVGSALAVCKSTEEMDILARLFKEHINKEHISNEVPEISKYIVECRCNNPMNSGNRC
ncbi:MAG: hypothetical protein QXT63_05970, partial [Thermoplasmata archaeon]